MRIALPLFALVAALGFANAASAQALRNPATPPSRAGLQPVDPPRQLSNDVTRPLAPMPALSSQHRCLQAAERSVQPTSDQRLATAQRRLTSTDVRRAAASGDVSDPTDRSGLRAQRDAQQRAMVRERSAAAQRLAVAQAGCR